MDTAAAPLLPPPTELAIEAYYSIPKHTRGRVELANARLKDLGYLPVPRSTLIRWVGQMKKTGVVAQQRRPSPDKPAPVAPLTPDVQRMGCAKLPTMAEAAARMGEIEAIPEALMRAIGPRMLIVAKGEGIDKVEQAIVQVAGAIASRADDIAAGLLDTEEESQTTKAAGEIITATTSKKAQAAKNSVGALATLADSLHRLMAARTMQSVAYRNFAEGDQLSGMGRKFAAEADGIESAARADNAKTISPDRGTGHGSDADFEDDAEAALREAEQK